MESKGRLEKEEFVVRAIKKLRGKYRGIHTVFSGFNEAFRQYFGEDPRPVTQEMAAKGVLEIRPVKGGGDVVPERRISSGRRRCPAENP